MKVTRDQLPKTFIIENLPDYYEIDEILELFEGGVHPESHHTNDDPQMIAVITSDPKDVENAIIFNDYEIEPEDEDYEPYNITVRKMESHDLRYFGGSDNEWEKLGDSVTSRPNESPSQNNKKTIEENIDTVNEEIIEIKEISELETKSKSNQEIVKEELGGEIFVREPSPNNIAPPTKETIILSGNSLVNSDVEEEIEEKQAKIIAQVQKQIIEEKINLEQAKEVSESEIVSTSQVEKKEKPLEDKPKVIETTESPRERKTATAESKRLITNKVSNRPSRPTKSEKQATTASTNNHCCLQNCAIFQKMKPYLENHVDFNDKDDVVKKSAIVFFSLIILINALRFIL